MKKIAKLSLVAAVAVAGLTNVNAASLEEAIKGVDVSGQFRFRAQDKSDTVNNGVTTDSGDNGTDVEIEVGVKVPVTENITAVFKIDNANDDTDASNKGGVTIEDYYFSYNQDALTVNAGQQNIPGRITDGAQGDGIVALYNLGNVTVGAAAFMTNSLGNPTTVTTYGATSATDTTVTTDGVGANDVYSVMAMGNFGPVSLMAQYADTVDYAVTYNVQAAAKVAMLNVGAEYTESERDANKTNEYSTLKAHVGAKVGIVSGKLSYAKTGDNGSGSIAEELEAASESLLWNVGSAGRADFQAYTIDASVAVTPAISLRAAYTAGEQGATNLDVTETLGQISYKVSKNLSTYVRFADVEDQGDEYTRGRVEARYSF